MWIGVQRIGIHVAFPKALGKPNELQSQFRYMFVPPKIKFLLISPFEGFVEIVCVDTVYMPQTLSPYS